MGNDTVALRRSSMEQQQLIETSGTTVWWRRRKYSNGVVEDGVLLTVQNKRHKTTTVSRLRAHNLCSASIADVHVDKSSCLSLLHSYYSNRLKCNNNEYRNLLFIGDIW